MEALGTVGAGTEVLLEAAGVALGLWIAFAGAVDGGVGPADDEAADGTEQVSGVDGSGGEIPAFGFCVSAGRTWVTRLPQTRDAFRRPERHAWGSLRRDGDCPPRRSF